MQGKQVQHAKEQFKIQRFADKSVEKIPGEQSSLLRLTRYDPNPLNPNRVTLALYLLHKKKEKLNVVKRYNS